jgi:predicted Zn-dependent protease
MAPFLGFNAGSGLKLRVTRNAFDESCRGEEFRMRLGRSQKAWIGLFVVLALALAGAAVRQWYQADPDAIFSSAEKAYHSGRYVEAGAGLERLERLRPPTYPDHYLRAQVDVALKRDQDALIELGAIPDDYPLAPLARLRAGQTEIRRGRTRPAEAAFLAALKLLPRAVQPHKELVYIYNIQHRQAELDDQLIALLDLNILDFQYVLHWTKTRNTIWNPKGDLPALEKFVAADPQDRWSRLALVEALRRLNRLDEAERVLAVLSPSDPGARTKRVLIAMDRGDFAAAESLLAEGRDDDPLLAPLRGQLALRRRDGPAAVRYYRIALAADPIDRAALSGLGTALCLVGQVGAAQPYLEAAGRHDDLWRLVARAATADGERDPKLPRQLGMACAAAHRYQEARAWLMLAIQRDPLDAESQRTLFDLAHDAPARSAAQQRSATHGAGS